MMLRGSTHAAIALVALSAFGALPGCDRRPVTGIETFPDESEPPPDDFPPDPGVSCAQMPACNAGVHVAADGPALLITDPTVLAEVPLERVLTQILQLDGSAIDAREMMQRLFDTMNDSATAKLAGAYHCDDADQPALAFQNGATFTCPRAEGALASSESFFQPGDPDSFFPVAIVNRFDLTPVDGTTCGQARIIYAKQSGLTEPNNRVFLIFESRLLNPMPGCLEACRPVADFWKGLENKTPADIATAVDAFFFVGLGDFLPAVHPLQFGLGDDGGGYGHEGGQVRVSMHMEDPWDMRELHLDKSPADGEIVFTPTTVKNNPVPSFFDPVNIDWASQQLRDDFIKSSLPTLGGADITSLAMFVPNEVDAVESALAGEKINDYLAATTASGDTTFLEWVDGNIASFGFGTDCPPDDPLNAQAMLRRATALSCAGCHAPNELLGPTRSVGCGLTWPDSIGQAHVTEAGALSPALKEVFLPHRAKVMETFLQACDMDAILGSFPSSGPGGLKKELSPGRTLGGSRTH